ncbi:TPA: cysteine--tRNA ligase [Candidatus Woesearchaeota archaeon]|nr:cysteine--tRNA ligase [Candidatus Woesearchaeota archaeon]HII69581.1 cysteine--tRNA ligase [Candidatus Woesearchaeota archaeon]
MTESTLHLFNTLARKKENFEPIDAQLVRMYSCGPTVYNYAHIGNFRAYIVADLLKKYLRFRGYAVRHVMNITDVDDKTIRDSQKEGKTLSEFTERYTKIFFEDIRTLNIGEADAFPMATAHIPEIIAMVKRLLEKGIAYKAEDGSVYYAVSKFPSYGELAQLEKASLKAGARIAHDEYGKDSAHDFALWKAYTPEDGGVFWDTELGKGRPGWHIECSAMSTKHLGEQFDIHTGGVDLIFPHHQNEIAQTEGCTCKQFVRYWVHNEHLLVEGKKMSKSLGNFYTLRDLLSRGHDPLAIRYVLLATHYRQQLNFTFDALDAAMHAISRLNNTIRKLKGIAEGKEKNARVAQYISNAQEAFIREMDNDLAIAEGLAVVFEFIRDVNVLIDSGGAGKKDASAILDLLSSLDAVLGVMNFSDDAVPADVLALVKKRNEARDTKEWALADALRNQIKEKGFVVEDAKEGGLARKA